jgi:hypothetical protein
MAWHSGPNPCWTPTPLGFIDSSKSSLVLNHYAQIPPPLLLVLDVGRDFFDRLQFQIRLPSWGVYREALFSATCVYPTNTQPPCTKVQGMGLATESRLSG